MSVKKKPATPKSKAKPPTGPARIRYQVGLNLILLAITPDPQVHYNGAAQTLQVTSLQAEVGFTSEQCCLIPHSVSHQNLAKADLLGGAPDSYVCTMLLPSTFNVSCY